MQQLLYKVRLWKKIEVLVLLLSPNLTSWILSLKGNTVIALEKQCNLGKHESLRLPRSSLRVWAGGQDMGLWIRAGLCPRAAVKHPWEGDDGLLALKGGGEKAPIGF